MCVCFTVQTELRKHDERIVKQMQALLNKQQQKMLLLPMR